MKKILSIISILLVTSVGFLQYQINDLKSDNGRVLDLGATIPTVVALFETSLASSISSTATSITLVTGTDKQGNALSGTYGFIIDEGSSSEEFVLCSASGTALTSCTRGISVTDGKTAVTALQKTHRRGASIKITNYPQLAILSRINNGSESFPNLVYYNAAKDFSAASSSVLVDKNYVDAGILAGCANSSTTVKGCVELATLAEILASTGTGGTGASLVVTADYFSASTSAANKVVVTNPSGYIDSSFLNISSTGGIEATGNNLLGIKLGGNSGLKLTSSGLSMNASPSFGGDGSDGALSITSGTTTLSFGGQKTLVKNYTSIEISGTGALAFSASNSYGSVAILRSQGACTITSSATRAIDLRDFGADGGTAGNDGFSSFGIIASKQFAGGVGRGTAAANGAGGVAFANYGGFYDYASSSANIQLSRRTLVVPGTGGGGAAGGGKGGAGGGSIILECGGALNITGTIDVSGEAGKTVANQSGGGGGSGGMIVILYKTLTADTGTYTVSGGAGGSGNNAGFGAGGGGMLGTAGSPGSGFNGGAGAPGTAVRMKNNIFY